VNLEILYEEIRATLDKATDTQLQPILDFARSIVDDRMSAASPNGLTEAEKAMSTLEAVKSIRDRIGVSIVVARQLYEEWSKKKV